MLARQDHAPHRPLFLEKLPLYLNLLQKSCRVFFLPLEEMKMEGKKKKEEKKTNPELQYFQQISKEILI